MFPWPPISATKRPPASARDVPGPSSRPDRAPNAAQHSRKRRRRFHHETATFGVRLLPPRFPAHAPLQPYSRTHPLPAHARHVPQCAATSWPSPQPRSRMYSPASCTQPLQHAAGKSMHKCAVPFVGLRVPGLRHQQPPRSVSRNVAITQSYYFLGFDKKS